MKPNAVIIVAIRKRMVPRKASLVGSNSKKAIEAVITRAIADRKRANTGFEKSPKNMKTAIAYSVNHAPLRVSLLSANDALASAFQLNNIGNRRNMNTAKYSF